MEKSAKLILKERKYHSNIKRHEKMMKEENLYRTEKFEELNDVRRDKKQITIDEE